MIARFGVGAVEEEAFDFVGGVERVVFFFVQFSCEGFQCAANVGFVGRAVFVDDFAEDEHFAGTEDVGRPPVKCAPVDAEAEVGFALRGEATDGGAVEGEVVVALDEEFLVVIEHVQAAFEVAEEHGDSLDALFVGKVLDALFLNGVRGHAVEALLLGLEIQLFQLVVREGQETTQFSRHVSPQRKLLRKPVAEW